MTLGRTGEDGINVKALSTNPFSVKGAVKSNSNINVVSGTLQSTAAVTAFGACSGTIFSTPTKLCNTNTPLADPNYASEATLGTPANAVPIYQAVPANISASWCGHVLTGLLRRRQSTDNPDGQHWALSREHLVVQTRHVLLRLPQQHQ